MVNIVNGHDLDTQSGRADFRAAGGYVEGNSSGGGYTYQTPSGQVGNGGGTQTPTQGATFNTPPSQQVGQTGTVAAPPSAPSGDLAAAKQAIQQAVAALNSSDLKAFNEQVREWDKIFQFNTDQFNEGVRQYNQNFGITQAGVTGTYNGQPTLQGLNQYANFLGTYGPGGPQTLQGQNQYYNQALAAAGLTGTFNPATAGYAPGSFLRDPATGAIYQVGPAGEMTYVNNPALIPAGANATNIVGLSAMTQGAPTQQAIAQAAAIASQQAATAQNWANIFGYVPGFDANGQPIAPGANATTLAAQQQAYSQQFNLAQLASQLQANPFRQAQVLGQANRILSGQPTAGFQAPATVGGVGTMGGNQQGGVGYLQQIVDDIKNPTPNQTTADQFIAQTPTPNKIDSQSFLRSAPSTQNLVLQAMQEKYGIDPNDALTQIKNTLPQFQAPTVVGSVQR